jgi:hypothetical protein
MRPPPGTRHASSSPGTRFASSMGSGRRRGGSPAALSLRAGPHRPRAGTTPPSASELRGNFERSSTIAGALGAGTRARVVRVTTAVVVAGRSSDPFAKRSGSGTSAGAGRYRV